MSFSDWWTNNNNPSLPKSEYLFGTRHIIMLVIAIVSAVGLSIIFFRKNYRAKRILLIVLASVLLFFEITSRVVNIIIEETYSLQRIFEILMPLHICSVAVWVVIIGVFSKNKVLLNFAAIIGLIATVGFLGYPAVGINRTYISFTCLYSITAHVTGFVLAILLMTLGFTKFEFKDIWIPFVCMAIMFAWGALVDFVILPGADYMYLRNDPLELNIGFPYHILYAIFLSVYITIFYIVYFIKEKIKKRKWLRYKYI